MRLAGVLRGVAFELASLRLYWPHVLTMSVLVPLSYLAIALFSAYDSPRTLPIALTGFVVISSFATLVFPLAHRVSSMFDDQIIELVASLPIGPRALIASYVLAYTLLSAPATLISLAVLGATSGIAEPLALVAGLLLTYAISTLLGILIGLLVRNKLKLDPILSTLLFLVVVLTPAFYAPESASGMYQLLLLNPLTHVLFLMRVGVGMGAPLPVADSLAYLAGTAALTALLAAWRLSGGVLVIVEKR